MWYFMPFKFVVYELWYDKRDATFSLIFLLNMEFRNLSDIIYSLIEVYHKIEFNFSFCIHPQKIFFYIHYIKTRCACLSTSKIQIIFV